MLSATVRNSPAPLDSGVGQEPAVPSQSVRNMFNRPYDKTVEFLQEVDPNYLKQLLEEEETTGEPTTTMSKKKGVRTTTITAD